MDTAAVVITDAQVHVWEAHRPDRPWPTEPANSKGFVAVEGARPHRVQPLGGEELVALMDGAGVARGVIVPPSPAGDSNVYALEVAAAYPQRFVVMGRFDPSAPGARDRLQHWLAQPHMAGIRMTFHKPQWSRWLDDGSIGWFWADCERLGIPLMLLIPGRLDAVAAVARAHPRLTLIVDHLGLHSNYRDEQCLADLQELVKLAVFGNVSVKASSVPCYTTQAYPFRNAAPWLRMVFDRFGPARMFWGSDVSRLPCTYREAVDHLLHELDFLSETDKAMVMGQALSRVLRWPQAQVAR